MTGLNERFNKQFVADSDKVFNRQEVEDIIAAADSWNFDYKKFGIYRAMVAFSPAETEFKSRPIITMKDNGDTVSCYPCTTKKKPSEGYYEKYPIEDWETVGLQKPGYINLTSKIDIDKRYIYKKIGKLRSVDIDNLKEIGL